MNRDALRWYEENAGYYDSLIEPQPPAAREHALRQLVAALPAGGAVLELGSGPGRDANFLESLDVRVQRTDATEAFLALQRSRGKTAMRLDVLADDFGGPWAFVLAMCVLLHVEREATAGVLATCRLPRRLAGPRLRWRSLERVPSSAIEGDAVA